MGKKKMKNSNDVPGLQENLSYLEHPSGSRCVHICCAAVIPFVILVFFLEGLGRNEMMIGLLVLIGFLVVPAMLLSICDLMQLTREMVDVEGAKEHFKSLREAEMLVNWTLSIEGSETERE